MSDVIFRHTCCYFSPHQFWNLQGSAPPWIRELHHRMGMPQPEKGHVFGNKLPLNALPNPQHPLYSIFLQVLTCTLLSLELLQFYTKLSFYFLYSSATENQLHMSTGMVPCQVLRVPLLFLVHCWARFIIDGFHLSSQSISRGGTISICFQCAHVMNYLWEVLSVT
jgi:hypothetical protein